MRTFERLALAAWLALAAQAAATGAGLMGWADSLHLCVFRFWWGVRCPGCGMGHALVAAFRGDWAGSFGHHPLGLPLLAVWTAWLAWGLANRVRGREFSWGVPALKPLLGLLLLGGILIAHVWRLA